MATFAHVLAATDLSPASQPALDLAVRLAVESGARLSVVHTCEVPGADEYALPADFLCPLVERARARLEELLAPIRGTCPGARAMVRVGAPAEQILAAAEEVGADLIVMSTHGRSGVAHALMGSVAERVIQRSPVPALTVRA